MVRATEGQIKYKSPPIHQTPRYRAKAAYANMSRRCENACGTEPAYAKVKLKMTRDEWLVWSVPRYTKFIQKYPNKTPTVSRKGDKGHYEIGNIKIVSLEINRNNMKMPGQATNGMKRCSTCKISKPVVDFSNKKTAKDGLCHRCKECCSIAAKVYSSKPEAKAKRKERRNK